MPRTRLAGEFRKIRTGTKADLRVFVDFQFDLRSNTGPLAEPSGQNTGNTVTTGSSGPAVHVSDRLLTATEKQVHLGLLHTRPIQWHLKSRVTKKGDSNSQVPAPPFTMVAKRRQCSHRSTITPNKTCSANIYRRIKRRVRRSLKRTRCKRVLVTSRKQAAYKLSGF